MGWTRWTPLDAEPAPSSFTYGRDFIQTETERLPTPFHRTVRRDLAQPIASPAHLQQKPCDTPCCCAQPSSRRTHSPRRRAHNN